MKAGRIGAGISAKILIGCVLICCSLAISKANQADRPEGTNLPPALAKVVQMIDSGVSEDVVLTYVQSSPAPRPNADDVIQLHAAGVPDRVTLALLSKKQPAIEYQNNVSEQAPASATYAQAPATPPQSSVYIQRSPVYAQPEPAVVYSSPSYYGYYPYSYNYWPAISLGFGLGFDHAFYGHHGYWHGGGSFGGHHGWVGGHNGGGHWGHH